MRHQVYGKNGRHQSGNHDQLQQIDMHCSTLNVLPITTYLSCAAAVVFACLSSRNMHAPQALRRA